MSKGSSGVSGSVGSESNYMREMYRGTMSIKIIRLTSIKGSLFAARS